MSIKVTETITMTSLVVKSKLMLKNLKIKQVPTRSSNYLSHEMRLVMRTCTAGKIGLTWLAFEMLSYIQKSGIRYSHLPQKDSLQLVWHGAEMLLQQNIQVTKSEFTARVLNTTMSGRNGVTEAI